MAQINIPEKYHEALEKLSTLPDATFLKLLEALSNLPIKVHSRADLMGTISSISEISVGDAKDISDALLGFCMSCASCGKETSTYLEEFIQALEKSPKLDRTKLEVLKSRLNQILNIASFSIATKAASVLFEHDRIFGQARVLTDIRPVFDIQADRPPKAAVIIHNLSIHYQQDGKHKEFFLAMDENDIQTLIETLKRAKMKAESIKKALASTQISYIATE